MQIYLSTGTITEKINGRNYKLLLEHHAEFDCDGFELIVFEDFYPTLNKISREYADEGINIPIMHFDKDLGTGIASPDEKDFNASLDRLYANLESASIVGAKRAVIHLWGRQDSDKYPEIIYERTGKIISVCRENGVEPLFENIFCCVGSPLAHLKELAKRYPDIRFIIDSRPAQFHAELEETLKTPEVMSRTEHIHINDYTGGYREWAKVNPIAQPTRGNIDWLVFFDGLRKLGYDSSYTLEAPAHRQVGVDSVTLNRSLDFIRRMARL